MSITTTDVATVVSRLLSGAFEYEEKVLRERAVHSGLMWRCTCHAINAYDGKSCAKCGADRLWTADATPPGSEYGKHLEDLRYALTDWFDDRAQVRRPAAVTFRVTTEYDDGPAWATWDATVHFTNSPDGMDYPHDFEHTSVADALVEISELDPPQTGDTLRVVVPAWGTAPTAGDAERDLARVARTYLP